MTDRNDTAMVPRSDATLAQPGAFRWTHGQDACSASGYVALSHIRASFGLSGPAKWDDALAGRMVEYARSLGTLWDRIATLLEADMKAQRASVLFWRFGLWHAFFHADGGRMADLALPDGVVLPAWGQTLEPAAGDLACVESAVPAAPATAAPAVPTNTSSSGWYGLLAMAAVAAVGSQMAPKDVMGSLYPKLTTEPAEATAHPNPTKVSKPSKVKRGKHAKRMRRARRKTA